VLAGPGELRLGAGGGTQQDHFCPTFSPPSPLLPRSGAQQDQFFRSPPRLRLLTPSSLVATAPLVAGSIGFGKLGPGWNDLHCRSWVLAGEETRRVQRSWWEESLAGGGGGCWVQSGLGQMESSHRGPLRERLGMLWC
jgi:hypothetical protein